MLNQEIKRIYDDNLKLLKNLGPYFSYESLMALDMHPAIKQFISASIEYLIFRDRQRLIENSYFNYSDQEILSQLEGLSEKLKSGKKYALKDIARQLYTACFILSNYLCLPRKTLVNFVFDEEKKSSEEILRLLDHLSWYPYFKKTITSYLERKKISFYEKEQFVNLIEQIDKLTVESDALIIIENAADAMCGFYSYRTAEAGKTSPRYMLLFLEEKNLKHHYDAINREFGKNPDLPVSKAELISAVNKAVPEKSDILQDILKSISANKNIPMAERSKAEERPMSETPAGTEIFRDDQEDDSEYYLTELPSDKAPDEIDEMPLSESVPDTSEIDADDDFEDTLDSGKNSPEDFEESIIDNSDNETPDNQEPEETPSEFRVIKNLKAPLIDHEKLLADKRIHRFIQAIFDYDMEDFENTIDAVSECRSESDVLDLLEKVFQRNGISHKSKEAESFKSLIAEYYI